MKDPYKVLGVDRNASDKAIKDAYRKLARKYHPDVNPGDAKAEERFKDVQAAYELLTDPKRKATWDQFGAAAFEGGAPPPGGGFGIPSFEEIFGFGGDLFSQIFGGAGGGGRRGRARPAATERPRDVEGTITISLEEAARGVEREVRYAREVACRGCGGAGMTGRGGVCPACGGSGQTAASRGVLRVAAACNMCHGSGRAPGPACPRCHGGGRTSVTESIRVRVPAGVEEGARLRVAGRGQQSGAGAGDLFLRVEIRQHPQFARDGDDLLVKLPVTIAEAALGAEVDVPTLDGSARVRIPAGTPSGRKLRLGGRGMTRRGGGKGDLYAEIRIVPPPKPSAEERELLERLAELSRFDPRA